MNVLEQLSLDMKNAMREKDKESLSTIRMISASLTKESQLPGKNGKLTDEEIQAVLSREVKSREQEIDAYVKVGNDEKVKSIKREIELVNKYRPKQMSEQEIYDFVKQLDYKDMKFGPLMGLVSKELKGKADGKLIKSVVEQLLG